MTPKLGKQGKRILVIALVILAVVSIGWIAYQFNQGTKLSERHDYSYSIDLSYTTIIENVTLLVPVPELDGIPFLADVLMNGTGYGIPPDWNLSIVEVNGTPMLVVWAARMVPEYHGIPIPVEPGASPSETPPPTASEYSDATPILMPVQIVATGTTDVTINTRHPLGHEPVFNPDGQFTLTSAIPPTYQGEQYAHIVPIYIAYTSDRPATVSLHASITGTNSIWRGGWIYNTYEDSITVELGDTTGWVECKGTLLIAEGVYW
ncbi:MAG: hypothetical protein LUO81_01700 [Methanoregulaceae archaeon]|nr:hypothetical protein [Methanoregulaceae archaeon]